MHLQKQIAIAATVIAVAASPPAGPGKRAQGGSASP